jgi:DNA-binding NarL/FixJ family response regulator
MRPVRVVVAIRPRLMRELLLMTIAGHSEIEIVAEIQDESEVAGVVDAAEPDFLIVTLGDSDQLPSHCHVLLRRHPDMKILAMAPDRNSSIFYWASFDIHSVPVEASEAGVLGTLLGDSKSIGGPA